MIQFHDLDRQYALLKEEVLSRIQEVISSRSFILGKYVAEFEDKFGRMHDSPFAAGCGSGTSAIALALEALGIKEGDEVITTPHTFIATAEAICHTGARPVFADVDPDTFNIDIRQIEPRITSRTKAIVPVHLYGNPVDMPGLLKIAKKHDLKVVEDCCQAHLAGFDRRYVGTFGDAGAFSFYPGKNLGAYGDAGAVIASSQELIGKIKMLLDHGRSSKYLHEIVGYNHRMDGIQAGVLLVKMKYLKEWTEKRQKIAAFYNECFKDNPGIRVPRVHPKAEAVYHLYVISVENRDKVAGLLKEKGILTSVHYPVPLHLQPAFGYLGYRKGDFPMSEHAADHVLSLPMFPELTRDEIKTVCDEVNKTVK